MQDPKIRDPRIILPKKWHQVTCVKFRVQMTKSQIWFLPHNSRPRNCKIQISSAYIVVRLGLSNEPTLDPVRHQEGADRISSTLAG